MVSFGVEDAPRVSVIVVAWRDAPYLLGCLASVAEHVRDVSYEVVVALNEPTRELEERVASELGSVTTVSTRVNVGFAGAVNLAARAARGEYLVLLNDDAEVRPYWLEALVAAADSSPEVGAVGSTILFPDGTVQEVGGVIWSDASATNVGRGLPAGSARYGARRVVDYASGCSLLVRRSTWEGLGGLDEGYFPAYYEDVDLCFRIRDRGQSVVVEPRSQVTHRLSASTGGSYRSFLLEHNRKRFATRWSARLAELGDPLADDPMAVERAVARAAGEPMQILVVYDRELSLAARSAVLDRVGAVAPDLLGSDDWEYEPVTAPLGNEVPASASRCCLVVLAVPALGFAALAEALREALPGVALVLDGEVVRRDVFVLEEARDAELAAVADAEHLICTSDEMVEALGRDPGRARQIGGVFVSDRPAADDEMVAGAPAAPSGERPPAPVDTGEVPQADFESLDASELMALRRSLTTSSAYARWLEARVDRLVADVARRDGAVERAEAYGSKLLAQIAQLAAEIDAKNTYIALKEADAAHLDDERVAALEELQRVRSSR